MAPLHRYTTPPPRRGLLVLLGPGCTPGRWARVNSRRRVRRDVLVSMLVKVATLKKILHPPWTHADLPGRSTPPPTPAAAPHPASGRARESLARERRSASRNRPSRAPLPAPTRHRYDATRASSVSTKLTRATARERYENESVSSPGMPRAAEMGTAQRMREHRVPNIAPTLRHTTSCSVRLPIEF